MKSAKIAAAAIISAAALSIFAAGVSAAEYEAFLMFTDKDWKWGSWETGGKGDTVVDGYGTYTVSLNSEDAEKSDDPANGALVFCVDIMGAAGEFNTANTNAWVDSIKADGQEVAVDNSKIAASDDNGNFRIEIWNYYGSTGRSGDAHYNPIDAEKFTVSDKLEVTFTLSPADGTTVTSAVEAETEAVTTEAVTEETTAAETTVMTEAVTEEITTAAETETTTVTETEAVSTAAETEAVIETTTVTVTETAADIAETEAVTETEKAVEETIASTPVADNRTQSTPTGNDKVVTLAVIMGISAIASIRTKRK